MKAKVFSHEKFIGTTEFYLGDESMGCLSGSFLPTENYYKYVQKAVWKFWSTNKPDYNKWTSLKMNIQLENGYFLFAAGGLTINDIQELPDEPKQIDVLGIDRHVIEDFFLEKQPRPFVEEPWELISIEQKIAFEQEIKKELGVYDNKSFMNFFSPKKNKHVLMDFETFALCRDSRNDDVLFRIIKPQQDQNFAVVHLTWKGAKEIQSYPRFEFYKDFDEFKYRRMYADKIDWEYLS